MPPSPSVARGSTLLGNTRDLRRDQLGTYSRAMAEHGDIGADPFAGGPRACIGEHLAVAELVAAVAALVRRYRLRSLPETPGTEVNLALRPKGSLPCRFEVL